MCNNIKKIRKYLKNNNKESGALFSACTFGNAITGEEKFVGEGNGRSGEKINEDMYWRWASITKFLGMILLCKALDDELIISIDEPVYKYIAEFSTINSWISGSTPVLIDGEQQYDKYGTPQYSPIISTEEGLGEKITIKMLIECSSGLGYTFWGLGDLRHTVDLYSGTQSGQNYISYIQLVEKNNGSGDTITSSYDKQKLTFTESIIERLKYPLLCYPGNQNIYDIGMTIVGGVIGSALKLKNICKTSAEYCQDEIFKPLGMNTCWLNNGSLNPPCNANEKLSTSYFVRQSYVDGQEGPDVKLNTLYNVFQKQAKGDGFTFQTKTVFLQEKTKKSYKNDLYAGGYDCSGVGTMSDYCKLIILVLNNGLYKDKRILSEQSIQWLLVPKYTPDQKLTIFGQDTLNFLKPGTTWCGGLGKYLENTNTIPFSCGPNTYYWVSYYGMSFYFDTVTKNYIVSGTQVSTSSWYLLDKQSPPVYEPNIEYLWKLSTGICY
jgi:CubicO group peptidase (beta-lactamase class C family)